MRRLPGGSLTAAAVLLGVLLLGAAFPDSFLFHRLFTVRRWPFPFRRDIVVLHVILAAVLLGWSVFTARFLKLRKDTAEAARECEAAWGRLSPLARDRAGVLTRLEAPLRRLAPGEEAFFSALEAGLAADGSAVTAAQQVRAANLLTKASALLPDLVERRSELAGNPQLLDLLTELQRLEERIGRLRAPYNTAATRFNRRLEGQQFRWMAGVTGKAGEWLLLHSGRTAVRRSRPVPAPAESE